MIFLDEIKSAEDPLQLTALRNNQSLQSLIVAWENMELTINVKKMAEMKTLKGLWLHCMFDYEELCMASGINWLEMPRLLELAKANRLIYPDGTINQQAKSYLRTIMAKHLRSLSDGKKKDPDSKPEPN